MDRLLRYDPWRWPLHMQCSEWAHLHLQPLLWLHLGKHWWLPPAAFFASCSPVGSTFTLRLAVIVSVLCQGVACFRYHPV